jgi:hypothetical protein
VNQLTYSEQFDNAAWVKSAGVSVSANTDVAPDGTITADTLTSGGNQIDQSISCSTNTVYTDSLHFKKTVGAAYQPGMYLLFSGGTLVIYAVRLNTDTGVATAVSAGGFTAPSSFSVTEVGNYWRLSITGNSNNNTTASFRLYANLSAGGGAGAGSQIIWGADLRVTNDGVGIPAYQRIAAATDYDTSGFPLYLSADGVDDRLIGPAISNIISASSYEACFGARLRSVTTNNAAQWLNNSLAADSLGYVGIGYATTGNVLGAFNYDGSGDAATLTVTPPSTFVLQQRHSAGSLVISTNGGTEVSTASGDTSVLTGDLRVFSSNGSASVNARLYGAVIRSTAFTTAERANVLAWMNGRTKAY